jgi:hypothetical protein
VLTVIYLKKKTKSIVGGAGERRRLLWDAFYFGLLKELLLLAVDVMLCY